MAAFGHLMVPVKATLIRIHSASRFLSKVQSNVSEVRRAEASRDISTAPQPKS